MRPFQFRGDRRCQTGQLSISRQPLIVNLPHVLARALFSSSHSRRPQCQRALSPIQTTTEGGRLTNPEDAITSMGPETGVPTKYTISNTGIDTRPQTTANHPFSELMGAEFACTHHTEVLAGRRTKRQGPDMRFLPPMQPQHALLRVEYV